MLDTTTLVHVRTPTTLGLHVKVGANQNKAREIPYGAYIVEFWAVISLTLD